jgi:glycosyltransferase involved in cell wall biosynthesis
MRVGVVIEETWSFFSEIYDELKSKHTTSLFKRNKLNLPVFQTRVNDYFFRKDLQNFLKQNEVVFFEWASELLVHASRLPKTSRIITRLHRYEMYQWADQINWDIVDKIILVSQAKKKEFISRFPRQAHKIVVIPEAIPLNRYQPRTKSFTGDIGILCHLTPRKRVYELILAFYELNRINVGFTLHIGGGRHPRFGDYFDALCRLVAELGLNEKVIFYGNVAEPQDWYSKVDIFISNSYSEGLQVSPMEAIAAGCYCLAHHWDGAEELLPDDNLYFTERELMDKVLRYTQLPAGEKQLEIEKLQKYIREHFDMDEIKVQIRQIVEEVGQLRSP